MDMVDKTKDKKKLVGFLDKFVAGNKSNNFPAMLVA